MSGYSVAGVPAARLFERTGDRTRRAGLEAELTVFAALAGFACAHWSGLVADGPGLRMLAVVAIATACGLALAGSAALPRGAGRVVRPVVAVASFLLGLVAMGLHVRYLAPAHWDELSAGLDRGLVGLQTVNYPIGADAGPWIELTLLLAAPAVCVIAACLAFWPAGRARPVLRFAALTLLLLLYGSALAQHRYDFPLLRGLVLLGLVAAWLWLPRLLARDVAAGAVALAVAGLVALPLAAKLDGGQPWLDYKHWRWHALAVGETFSWDHSYGPLAWPRKGRTVLFVKSARPFYWKAETLDGFDGFRWYRSAQNSDSSPASEIPGDVRIGRFRGGAKPQWFQEIQVSVQRLRSPVAIGAGTTFFLRGAGAASYSSDGTTQLESPLKDGDSYRAEVYVPQPTAAQLARVPGQYDAAMLEYTNLSLPRPGETFDDRVPAGEVGRPEINLGLRGNPGSATPGARRELLRSPYAGTYRLARRLAAGQAGSYEVVRSVETYLKRDFVYNERVPRHNFPLPAFLFRDRMGYCQQFSGAMALLLRMNGIPARVATGFAPGIYDASAKEWRVRDQDAHSWVEVWFAGIGWVDFDPTPPAAPARNRTDAASAAARGGNSAIQRGQRQVPPVAERTTNGGPAQDQGGALPWWAIGFGVVAVLALMLVGLAWARPAAARRREHPVDADLRELESALPRLGYELEPGMTLAQLERRLARAAGPEAAAYVAHLRELRYSQVPGAGPTRRDRSALRRALARTGGPLQRLRAFVALPPGLGAHRRPRPAG